MSDSDLIDAVNMHHRLQHDLACVTGSLEDTEKTSSIRTESVVPHLQIAAQSLSVAIDRFGKAAVRKFGADAWAAVIENEEEEQ